MKIAFAIYYLLQLTIMVIFSGITDLVQNDTWSYIFVVDVMLTLILYALTSLKDPGFVPLQEYQFTDVSHPMKKKANGSLNKIIESHQIPSHQFNDEEAPPKSKRKQSTELQCEASVDVDPHTDRPEIDVNELESNAKTPEKRNSKVHSISQSPKEVRTSTQIVSQGSTKEDKQEERHATSVIIKPGKSLDETVVIHENENSAHDDNMDKTNNIFIERRYCSICNQDQAIRSKHCNRCGRCVALFDHHCPWTGNCVGERNRCVFYWFLFFQFYELIYSLVIVLQKSDFSTQQTPFLVVLQMIAICFVVLLTCMVFSLLAFQTVLSFKNLTTWEYKSWKKISYLKDFPEIMGSPFSEGWKMNLRQYCRCSIKTLTQWEYSSRIVNNIR